MEWQVSEVYTRQMKISDNESRKSIDYIPLDCSKCSRCTPV